MYVGVCKFSGKTNNFDFFSPNLPKNESRVGDSKNYCWNKNRHFSIYHVCQFLVKMNNFEFFAQICPKKDLGLETEKGNADNFDFFDQNLPKKMDSGVGLS